MLKERKCLMCKYLIRDDDILSKEITGKFLYVPGFIELKDGVKLTEKESV